MIRSSPTLFGLFGHPVSHSLSPRMQNAAFRATGRDGFYAAFDVTPAALAAALEAAGRLGFGGLNVTVPHKEAALAAAAAADPLARCTGACNTLVPTAAGWKAFNTDVGGFLQAVADDLGFHPRGRTSLVLGAGGAARAAVVGLCREGAQEILLVNRNRERAEKLAAELASLPGGSSLSVLEPGPAIGRLEPGDLLVSATPLGLDPEGAWPWGPERLGEGILVYDMAYRPGAETALVRQARGVGLRAASGRSMLLYQGALAFALWTGDPAPLGVMAEALAGEPPQERG